MNPVDEPVSDELRRRAEARGIACEYHDGLGRHRVAPAAVLEAVLAALAAAERAGESRTLEHDAPEAPAFATLPPVLVLIRAGGDALYEPGSPALVLPDRPRGALRWRLRIALEDGGVIETDGDVAADGADDDDLAADGHGGALGHAPLRVPWPPLPLGYHDLELTLEFGAGLRRLACRLVVAPPRCHQPEDSGVARGAGLLLNLYAVRDGADFGVGDLGTLRRALRLAARRSLDFVGVNPLHAIRNTRDETSPYSPTSRSWRNWLYVELPAVPEWRLLSASLRRCIRARGEALAALQSVDYEAVARLKLGALRAMHRAQRGGGARAEAFARYARRHGEALWDHATFEVLESRHGYGRIPADCGRPSAPATAAFRERHARRVEFRAWLQFETERQLAACADTAARLGLRLRVYQDLAVGVRPDGADPWVRPDLFARGCALGAPPDMYSSTGQNWGLVPYAPDALARDGYRAFGALLRANLAHAGVLRIDHAIGLVRQYWIPDGHADGVLVRFPARDLLAVIALESVRARAVVVGEDLGTVPDELPGLLQRFGILSSRVGVFERRGDRFAEPRDFPERALATLNTHDLPPLLGWLAGSELSIRRATGSLETDADLENARAARHGDAVALVATLGAADAPRVLADVIDDARGAGGAGGDADPGPATGIRAECIAAAADYVGRSRSVLAAVFLDDVCGETRPVNVPGATNERWPCWSRRLRRELRDLGREPAVRDALDRLVQARKNMS